jgi:competence protein ComEC
VAFGLGAAGYLTLRIEPPLWLAALIWLIGVGAALAVRRSRGLMAVAIPLALVAFALSGVLAGKIRTLAVAAPVATAIDAPRRVEGYVVDVASPGSGGGRLVVAPVWIRGLAPEQTPKRINVSITPDEIVAPGTAVSLLAFVGPPPGPASPGAYDFARDAYFRGVGGVGFTRTTPEVIDLGPAPLRLRVIMAINAVRWDLAKRIVSVMGPQTGGVATAMVTGHAVWITPEQVGDMRASGLAHILSISGLHMAIVGGFVFALARLIIAAVPWLALRVPGKKLAALLALAALGAYLVISGWPPPAQRSAITAAVAFGAILADRRAITLHALAIAALVILALQPEAACQPGFQMSFAATAALVALAEAWPHPVKEISAPLWIRGLQGAWSWLWIGLGASFVAGLATGPFALQHFNRVAVYGLLSNLIIEPVSSFVMMPFLFVGTVLTPFGLGGPFLAVAGWSIQVMAAVAHAFSVAPGAVIVLPSAPDFTLPVSMVGILMICLWRGPMRLLGLPLALAVNLWPRPPAPQIWLAGNGGAAAIRDGKTAVLMRPQVQMFAADLWARRRGLTIAADPKAASATRFKCDRKSCLPRPTTRPAVAGWWWKSSPSVQQLSALCAAAEVVVVRGAIDEPSSACAGRTLLAGGDFARGGAAELYRRPDGGWRVVWSQPLRGVRPWTAKTD